MTDHRVRGVEWQHRATAALGPVTDLFPRRADGKVSWDDVVLDQFAVVRADRCLRAADPDEDYEESASNARRRVGLEVLARVREDGVDPMTAFGAVLDDRDRLFSIKLSGWIDTLGPGGRAALAAEVVTWVASVAGWPPLAHLGHRDAEVVHAGLDWDVPQRAVKVRARADVLAPRGARPPGRRLLVVGSTLTGAEVVAGHTALGYTLSRASVPEQVTVLVPASGAERFGVDDDVLDAALTRLVAAAAAAVAARMGPEAPATPGSWCRWCGLREECPESLAWTAEHPVRFGGLVPITVRGGGDDRV